MPLVMFSRFVILSALLIVTVMGQREYRYIETLVKLRVPKKESKRSTEGGLGHVPFRIWIPAGVKVIRWQKEGSFRLVLRFFMFIPNLTSLCYDFDHLTVCPHIF